MPNSQRKRVVAVFGATGGTGRHILDLASGRGLLVRTLARSADRLRGREGVAVVSGDVLDPGAVRETLRGADYAVSVLGVTGARRDDRTLSAGTGNIIDAMRGHGIDRFVCVTGFGLGDSRMLAAPLFRFVILPLLARAYADKERQEEQVRRSGLGWTVVRPTHLTDARPRGRVRHITDRSRWYDAVSRADVAEFIMDQLDDDRFRQRSVSIGAW